jgi:hypothetical protein
MVDLPPPLSTAFTFTCCGYLASVAPCVLSQPGPSSVEVFTSPACKRPHRLNSTQRSPQEAEHIYRLRLMSEEGRRREEEKKGDERGREGLTHKRACKHDPRGGNQLQTPSCLSSYPLPPRRGVQQQHRVCVVSSMVRICNPYLSAGIAAAAAVHES